MAAARSPVSSRPVITSPATNPSIANVLALPELVHEILDYLPFQDLFTASRACGGFKDTINNTRTLREKLACESVQVTRFQRNRQALFKNIYRGSLIALDASGHEIIDKWLLCPLLSRTQGHRPHESARAGPGTADDKPQSGNLEVSLYFSAEQYFADPATWRSVYLTSPPPSQAIVTFNFDLHLPSRGRMTLTTTTKVGSPQGDTCVTVGRLVDAVMASSTVRVVREGANEAVTGRPFEVLEGEEFSERIRRAEVEMGVKAMVSQCRCCVFFARG